MPEQDDPMFVQLQPSPTWRSGAYDLPTDLNPPSDWETLPSTPEEPHSQSDADEDTIFSHMRKHTLTGTITAHTQIYVVNEQIVHGTNIWNTPLCAFDNLHSANTEARTHAMQKHAKGDASQVQVYWRNGHGTWTTVNETERGRIVKSISVTATILQHLADAPIRDCEEDMASCDRIMPSRVPGSQRGTETAEMRDREGGLDK
ncbi:hypothetical protein N0V90_005698 [Kalmusia sp. IMI 367209]|nr:hypothetical protein N0V90_005698 [Kalmusia sp. IMI 367209]